VASSCLHQRWIVEDGADQKGMTVERCSSCGKARKVYGTWNAILLAGHLKSSRPRRVVPTHSDGLDGIAYIIKNGYEAKADDQTDPLG
jgi:hypothetical protein